MRLRRVRNKKTGIKAWAEADRPREKLINLGRRALSDVELLAILLGSGNKEESAVEVSKKILKTYNNDLLLLGKATVKQLSKFKGIGEAKSINIIAALELSRRRNKTNIKVPKEIKSAIDTYAYMRPHYADLSHEEFWIILLNRANHIINKHFISKGGQSGTFVDPKIIFKVALEHNASAIVLTHNHPSGRIYPSAEDISLTKKIVEGGKILDISIFDHVIVTNESYYSFADELKI